MYCEHISVLSTSIAISALKQFIIYIWYLQKKKKLEVARFHMIALNGWYTHCWRAEKRRVRGLPAGKAEKMSKISTYSINRISRRRGRALWEFQ